LNFGAGTYIDLFLIVVVAVLGKWGGTMIGARSQGMSRKDACQISPTLFSMMVCMALVTTCMATPFMDWLDRKVRTHNQAK